MTAPVLDESVVRSAPRRGVMTTPALVVNDEVVVAGRIPSEHALTSLLEGT
jgi:hypothetical protein